MSDVECFKVSNYRIAKALSVEIERLWETYVDFCDTLNDGLGLNDKSFDRLYRIGKWHRLKWLERSDLLILPLHNRTPVSA